MGMLDEWPKKFGEAKFGGIDPSAPPQQFLGQILNNVVGDKQADDGDGIRESASPIDFIAPEAAGALSGAAKKVGQVAMEAAPRLIGNEMGAIGSDLSGLRQSISDKAAAASPYGKVSLLPTAEQAANDAGSFGKVTWLPTAEQAANDAGSFGKVTWQPTAEQTANEAAMAPVVDQAKALQNAAKDQAFANQRANTKMRMDQRNQNQLSQARDTAYQKLKQALGNQ